MGAEAAPVGELKLNLQPVESSQPDTGAETKSTGGTPPLLVVEQEEKASFLPPPPPLREEQVQNAVNFLSHPNVKSSPVKYRRSFLEKKGLTASEIDEAFRRVPDPPTGDASVDPSNPSTSLPKSTTVQTLKIPAQTPTMSQQSPQQLTQQTQYSGQPMGVAPSQLGSGQLYAPVSASVIPSVSVGPQAPERGIRWTQMVLAFGVLAAGGAGAAILTKNHLLPRLKQWLRSVVMDDKEESVPPPAGSSRTVAVEEKDEKETEKALVKALEVNATELREALSTLKDAVQAVQSSSHGKDSQSQVSVAELRKELRTFASTLNEFSGHSSPDSKAGLHSEIKEFKHVLQEAIQAVKPKAGGGQEIYPTARRLESNGDGQLTVLPASAPPSAPYGAGFGGQPSVQTVAAASTRIDEAPHSKSYMEVLEMVQKGEKPPGIRDIDDKPPDPTRPLSDPQLKPRQKPWQPSSISSLSSNTTSSDSQWWEKRGSGYLPHSSSPSPSPSTSTSLSSPYSSQYNVGTVRPSASGHRVVITETNSATDEKDSNPNATNVSTFGVDNRFSQESRFHRDFNYAPDTVSRNHNISIAREREGERERESDSLRKHTSGWVPPPAPLPVLPEAAVAMRQQLSDKLENRGGVESQKQSNPQNISQTMTQNNSQNGSPNLFQHIPKVVSENVPQNVPQLVPQDVPQSVPQNVPQNVPQLVSHDVPQYVPQNVPQLMPQDVPQFVPQNVPQNVPQLVPQDLPQSVSQNVPHDAVKSGRGSSEGYAGEADGDKGELFNGRDVDQVPTASGEDFPKDTTKADHEESVGEGHVSGEARVSS